MPSTVIAKFKYEALTQSLQVQYVSGAVYEYKKVPPEIYEEMKQAFSKGQFLNTRIKGHYEYEKISD